MLEETLEKGTERKQRKLKMQGVKQP